MDYADVVAVIAGNGDPHRRWVVVGQAVVLESEARPEHRDLGPGPAVHDLHAVDGGDQEILVTAATEVGGHHRADDPAHGGYFPHRGPVGPVQRPDRTREPPGLGALDDVKLPIALDVGQCRARGRRCSRVFDQTRPRRVVKAFTVSVSVAPG